MMHANNEKAALQAVWSALVLMCGGDEERVLARIASRTDAEYTYTSDASGVSSASDTDASSYDHIDDIAAQFYELRDKSIHYHHRNVNDPPPQQRQEQQRQQRQQQNKPTLLDVIVKREDVVKDDDAPSKAQQQQSPHIGEVLIKSRPFSFMANLLLLLDPDECFFNSTDQFLARLTAFIEQVSAQIRDVKIQLAQSYLKAQAETTRGVIDHRPTRDDIMAVTDSMHDTMGSMKDTSLHNAFLHFVATTMLSSMEAGKKSVVMISDSDGGIEAIYGVTQLGTKATSKLFNFIWHAKDAIFVVDDDKKTAVVADVWRIARDKMLQASTKSSKKASCAVEDALKALLSKMKREDMLDLMSKSAIPLPCGDIAQTEDHQVIKRFQKTHLSDQISECFFSGLASLSS